MHSGQFNPFTDRLSRDIRNSLSSALTSGLATGSLAAAEEVATALLKSDLPDAHEAYVKKRLESYREAILSAANVPDDPIAQSIILWNLGLFFEVHEVLEQVWLKAEGEEKLFLQALIRAAGVYIKTEAGYPEPARRIAAKALAVLDNHRERAARWFQPEPLLAALRQQGTPAPQLSRE